MHLVKPFSLGHLPLDFKSLNPSLLLSAFATAVGLVGTLFWHIFITTGLVVVIGAYIPNLAKTMSTTQKGMFGK